MNHEAIQADYRQLEGFDMTKKEGLGMFKMQEARIIFEDHARRNRLRMRQFPAVKYYTKFGIIKTEEEEDLEEDEEDPKEEEDDKESKPNFD
ncbi:hypothetical protein J1N35_005529 [Gossypium stocksii]|uniref:Uncharacterized protein n=1 Tax=Gossypium stocksii TaxID=47602 RepID=A0A9D3WD31_9ROSI|nr:hypothetical protein J1N35_005529 [Gossypium stocksii]